MDYSRDQINRWEDEYKLPCDGKVRNAICTLIEKEAVDVLNQLMKADDHPFGGWAIFRP